MSRNACLAGLGTSAIVVNSSVSPAPFGTPQYDDGGWLVSSGTFKVPSGEGIDRIDVRFNITIGSTNPDTMYVAQVLRNGLNFIERAAESQLTPPTALPATRGVRLSGTTGEFEVDPDAGDVFTIAIYSDPADPNYELDHLRSSYFVKAVPA